MISSETVAWSSLLLTQVVTIAARGLILAAGAGLGLTAFRVKSTGCGYLRGPLYFTQLLPSR